KVEKHIIENDSIITLTVASASLSVNDNSMDLHYKDQDEYKLEDSIEIIKPIVDFNGNVDIDEERTTVTITKNSTTLASIKLSEWADNKGISLKDYVKVEDGKISLIFKDDGKYTISYKVEGTVGAGDTYSVTLSAGDVVAPELEIGDNILNEKSYNVDTPLSISFSNKDLDDSILSFSDINTNEDELLETLVVKIKYEDGAYEELENVAVNSDADKAEGKVNYVYNYEFEQKGKYTLSFTITDKAGNKTTKYKEIEVGVDEASSADVAEIMGGVLIGLSVVLLAGVVVYFVASKKKLDKKEKSYRRETKSKK
ncbi:MAG: hypothetical protein J6A28_00765, partial [Clostridia bacterium]|nr:hypothetical protein [Clostridia bacterium]